MNRFLAFLTVFFGVMLGLSASATDVFFDLTEVPGFGAVPATNRQITLQQASPFPGNVIFLPLTDSTGRTTNWNSGTGLFNGQIKAPPGLIQFQIWVGATNLGSIDALTIPASGSSSTYPAGQVAWSIFASDQRYQLSGTSLSNTFYPAFSNPSNYVQTTTLLSTSNFLQSLVNSTTNGTTPTQVSNIVNNIVGGSVTGYTTTNSFITGTNRIATNGYAMLVASNAFQTFQLLQAVTNLNSSIVSSSNLLALTKQPATLNLTNWSLLSTNVIPGAVATANAFTQTNPVPATNIYGTIYATAGGNGIGFTNIQASNIVSGGTVPFGALSQVYGDFINTNRIGLTITTNIVGTAQTNAMNVATNLTAAERLALNLTNGILVTEIGAITGSTTNFANTNASALVAAEHASMLDTNTANLGTTTNLANTAQNNAMNVATNTAAVERTAMILTNLASLGTTTNLFGVATNYANTNFASALGAFTNQAELTFVQNTGGVVRGLTVHSNLNLGRLYQIFTVTNSMVGIVGGPAEGTYLTSGVNTWTNMNYPLWAILLSTSYIITSNSINEFTSANLETNGAGWASVNGMTIPTISHIGVSHDYRGELGVGVLNGVALAAITASNISGPSGTISASNIWSLGGNGFTTPNAEAQLGSTNNVGLQFIINGVPVMWFQRSSGLDGHIWIGSTNNLIGEDVNVNDLGAGIIGGNWNIVNDVNSARMFSEYVFAGWSNHIFAPSDTPATFATNNNIWGGFGNTLYAGHSSWNNDIAFSDFSTLENGFFYGSRIVASRNSHIFAFSGSVTNDTILGANNASISNASYSIAMGINVAITNNNVLAYSDGSIVPLTSTTNNQVLLQAANGVGINTNSTGGNALRVGGTIDALAFTQNGNPITGGGATNLTPWPSDINANTHSLTNAATVNGTSVQQNGTNLFNLIIANSGGGGSATNAIATTNGFGITTTLQQPTINLLATNYAFGFNPITISGSTNGNHNAIYVLDNDTNHSPWTNYYNFAFSIDIFPQYLAALWTNSSISWNSNVDEIFVTTYTNNGAWGPGLTYYLAHLSSYPNYIAGNNPTPLGVWYPISEPGNTNIVGSGTATSTNIAPYSVFNGSGFTPIVHNFYPDLISTNFFYLHGLGHAPNMVSWTVVFLIATNGWQAGDEMDMQGNAANCQLPIFWKSSTAVGVQINGYSPDGTLTGWIAPYKNGGTWPTFNIQATNVFFRLRYFP